MRDTTENTPHRVVFRASRNFPNRLISFPPALVCAGTAIPSIAHPITSTDRFHGWFPQIAPQIISADRSAERYPYSCENRDDLDSILQLRF
jgi:hypothetical protein